MSRKSKADTDDGLIPTGKSPQFEVEKKDGEKLGRTLARVTLDPQTRNANMAMAFGGRMFGDSHRPDLTQSSAVLAEEIERTAKGDLGLANRMFTAQAITLDTMFTELARRAAENMASYPQATERYARLALKAQSNCRATLEALAKLHQPREQTVKHVHINEGGQAVVADHFHQHRGVTGNNAKTDKQSHATGAAGASATLPSPDPCGNGMPVTGCEVSQAMPYARRG